MNDEKIDELTEELYRALGSSSGVLFGIPANLRHAVRAIVKVVANRKSDLDRLENSFDEDSVYTKEQIVKEINEVKEDN